MAETDNEFEKEIDDFFSDIERIPIDRLQQKAGLSHGDAHRLKIDIALKLRDAQHTKALNQHTEALARLSGFDPLDNFFRVVSSEFPRRGEPEMGLNSL